MDIPSTLYHVTPTRSWTKIQREGLLPKIGPRARRLGEKIPRIYFFPTIDEVDNALMNWLGEELTGRLAILEISVPKELRFVSDVAWEFATEQAIHPRFIRLVRIEEE